jgi:hypothetical protein
MLEREADEGLAAAKHPMRTRSAAGPSMLLAVSVQQQRDRKRRGR